VREYQKKLNYKINSEKNCLKKLQNFMVLYSIDILFGKTFVVGRFSLSVFEMKRRSKKCRFSRGDSTPKYASEQPMFYGSLHVS
jgi:hypothetical protein